MNPETKATSEQIQAICFTHGIAYMRHFRITTGFSHEVHRVNDDFILKLYNSGKDKNFGTEAAMLASSLQFPKPKFIAKGETNETVKRKYILMSYVPGVSLGSRWHGATNVQREALIHTVCDSLRIINQLNPSRITFGPVVRWQDSIRSSVQSMVAGLKAQHKLDDAMADRALSYMNESIHIFADDQLHPVYWDIHFDNFIVNDTFELQAIIDLENVELTTLDYPLFVVQKLTDEPEKYLSADHEKYADKKDYTALKGLYRHYYPEMFAFPELDKRVKIYQLQDTLHLLDEWSHVKSLHAKLMELVSPAG